MSGNKQNESSLHGPNLILDVENFGPIAEAKNVEFKPMTVFVGPSNTGKSYLAMLLHAMLEGMRDVSSHVAYGWLNDLADPKATKAKRLLSETTALLGESAYRHRSPAISEIPIGSYSHEAREILHNIAENQCADVVKAMLESIRQYFEFGDLSNLRTGFPLGDGRPTISIGDNSSRWSVSLNSGTSTIDINDVKVKLDRREIARYMGQSWDDEVSPDWVFRFAYRMLVSWLTAFTGLRDSVYFPSARTGILTSHRVMTDSLLRDAHRFSVDVTDRPIIPYHKVSRDFLRLINGVTSSDRSLSRNGRRSDGRMREVARAIEQAVLHGTIEVIEGKYGPPDFEYHPSGYRELGVPMFRSSSMVTELAPIVAFLRSYIEVGDVLIIEEPEAHLHPAAQQTVAAVLAYMVRKGFRVLVTTHSHYIVEQLGALVNAGADTVDPEERARHLQLLGRELDRDLYLTQDEVAVYEFEPRADNGPSDVMGLEFDPDLLGYYPLRYSDALTAQRNRNVHMIGAREGF